MTITQLVTQAQAGSRAAFGELYESLAGDLYRMALYTLGSHYQHRKNRTILVQSFLHKIPPFRSLDQSCRGCGREK